MTPKDPTDTTTETMKETTTRETTKVAPDPATKETEQLRRDAEQKEQAARAKTDRAAAADDVLDGRPDHQ